MKIAVIKERAPNERRVALVPAHVSTLIAPGVTVTVERGAGESAGFPDTLYREKGAEIADRQEILASADVVVTVRGCAGGGFGSDGELAEMKSGAIIVGQLAPYAPHPSFAALVEHRLSAFSLERIPRITRAQSMDVLSSQANLAGYRAVLLGALELSKIFPMMMTAAGTVVPARVFIVGVGVAGLQAIATARRLGAVVSAYDIRPAVKEQVESLGARFVEIDLDAGETESGGGYAREMDAEFYRKQQEKMLEVVAESDVVITTAAIPGRKAPVLITEEMVAAMHPGAVIVDIAAERGGNCELTRPGETVLVNGVHILGPENIAAGVANHASQLFSKNITTFLETIIRDGQPTIDRNDEIVAATLIMEDGVVPDAELAEQLGLPAAPGTAAPTTEKE
ncbi:MAG: Re/Si-specific NAD(P)(+) transhydrogenase subunit alpha [Spirochaeta sp.]|jgi:NAD(P) transhydrogenase subunit alpha|nr:Re/Si-specific NAD(P)(+) transhydrogenase subunit alpha [Spirochaeta sp.]